MTVSVCVVAVDVSDIGSTSPTIGISGAGTMLSIKCKSPVFTAFGSDWLVYFQTKYGACKIKLQLGFQLMINEQVLVYTHTNMHTLNHCIFFPHRVEAQYQDCPNASG